MHYKKITLANKLYLLDPEELILKEVFISAIRLICKYDGQTELMVPGTGTIEFKLRSGLRYTLFDLDEAGYIIDENQICTFSHDLAKEELIVAKTKEQYVI